MTQPDKTVNKIPVSVVIICKNEVGQIYKCIQSVITFTDDIVVYDSGSTDGTQQLVTDSGARLIEGEWLGFGLTKKKATEMARYDWILNLDADEIPDAKLKQNLQQISFNDPKIVYRIRFKNFLGNQHLRFGEWGNDKHVRIFNRTQVNWNDASVHESLLLSPQISIETLPGFVLHYTVKNVADYAAKTIRYGLLNAEKYHLTGKRSSVIKIYLAPVFAFIKYYFFFLGFLDGINGLICARMTAYYTFIKYIRLKELHQESQGTEQ
ncbi:MAG: glycosyltransferase family 2 protein [Chitinophagaceae bacterium]|jgi:glycosyltransferase involved in cell wall biosynthesis|nr:glycosyltransferase family 2 protein [Chitinophagaceae bacterium]